MPMNKKFIILLALILILSGCSKEPPPESEPASNPDIAVSGAIDEVPVRDLSSVYKDDDDTSVITMYLTVTAGNAADNTNHTWDDVNSHSIYYYNDLDIPRYYVEGLLQIEDERVAPEKRFGYNRQTPNVRVAIRGKTTSRGEQKSYKLSIMDDVGKWQGQSTIALNKHIYDPVRFKNKMSYDMLKTIPAAFSAKTQFVHLFVKDLSDPTVTDASFVDYGLYTQVEQFSKAYLRNHGLDENGHLYKPTMFEFLRYADEIKLKTDPHYDVSLFESRLQIKGNDDHTKLIDMLSEINDYSTPIEEVFPKHFDEDNYFTWLAFQMLTGNTDTITQNFFLYSPQNAKKWYFLSWDNDDAWGIGQRMDSYNFEMGVSNYWGSVLHQRVLKSPAYRKKLDEKVNEIRALFPKEKVAAMVTSYQAVLQPFISRLPDSANMPLTGSEYNRAINLLSDEIEHNYEMYKIGLKKPLPFFLEAPDNSSGKTRFMWEPSYDFYDGAITYDFEVARDYRFTNVLSRQTGLKIPQAVTEKLTEGNYFYRVTAKNEAGETQTAMEIYGAPEGNLHGIRAFHVDADGTIE